MRLDSQQHRELLEPERVLLCLYAWLGCETRSWLWFYKAINTRTHLKELQIRSFPRSPLVGGKVPY